MKKAVIFLAAGFGLGYLPFAPGTWGTSLGIGLFFLFSKPGWAIYALSTITFSFLAIWLAEKAQKFLEKKDPPQIVIDEVAGLLFALFLIPFSFKFIVAGFILFRLFDILKPPPIKWLEKLPGGVVLDDIAAGILANICLQLIISFSLL